MPGAFFFGPVTGAPTCHCERQGSRDPWPGVVARAPSDGWTRRNRYMEAVTR